MSNKHIFIDEINSVPNELITLLKPHLEKLTKSSTSKSIEFTPRQSQLAKTKENKMADKYANRIYKIERLNYNVIAKVIPEKDNMYIAEVLKIEGETLIKVGDTLPISKRELELRAVPSSSIK